MPICIRFGSNSGSAVLRTKLDSRLTKNLNQTFLDSQEKDLPLRSHSVYLIRHY